MKIDYKQTVNFEGRNGFFKQGGLSVETYKDGVITIYPITSRGKVATCQVEIPKENIQDFIDILNQLKS